MNTACQCCAFFVVVAVFPTVHSPKKKKKKKTVHRECVCRKQDAHTGIEEEAGVDILLCAHSQASTTEIQPLFASGVVVCK